MPEAALDAALCDNYPEFLAVRSNYLQERAKLLAGDLDVPIVPPEEIDDSDEDPTE